MREMLIPILIVVNIPVYFFIGWLAFDSKDNAADTFFDTIIAVLKMIFIPGILSSSARHGYLRELGLVSNRVLFGCVRGGGIWRVRPDRESVWHRLGTACGSVWGRCVFFRCCCWLIKRKGRSYAHATEFLRRRRWACCRWSCNCTNPVRSA